MLALRRIADIFYLSFFEFFFLTSLQYLLYLYKNYKYIFIYLNVVSKFFFKMFFKIYYVLIRENFSKIKFSTTVV